MAKNIKAGLLLFCIHFLGITNSNASDKAPCVYEYLPEIAIPGVRKIIILMYQM